MMLSGRAMPGILYPSACSGPRRSLTTLGVWWRVCVLSLLKLGRMLLVTYSFPLSVSSVTLKVLMVNYFCWLLRLSVSNLYGFFYDYKNLILDESITVLLGAGPCMKRLLEFLFFRGWEVLGGFSTTGSACLLSSFSILSSICFSCFYGATATSSSELEPLKSCLSGSSSSLLV